MPQLPQNNSAASPYTKQTHPQQKQKEINGHRPARSQDNGNTSESKSINKEHHKTLKPAYDLYSERPPNDVFLEILTETWAHAAHCPSLHTS